MDRRDYLAAVTSAGTVALAGCSNITGGGGGPEYERGQKDAMLLSIDAFPDGWVRDDEYNENFDASFLSADETIIVLTSVEIADEVSGAKDQMEASRAGASEVNDYPIADEAYWSTRNDQVAFTLFRDSNAIGQVGAIRQSGVEAVPDQSRSQEYAGTMYENWQGL